MEIKEAKFIKGIRGSDELLEGDFPQIAFYGRSNVGKSSSINAVLGRKKLVKSSSTPGKTKELNLFEINNSFHVIDTPGYGYAKLSEREREKLGKLIRWYIFESGVKKRINVLVLDAKVGLTDLDKQILKALVLKGEKVLILMNKIDKLRQKDLSRQRRELEDFFKEGNIKIIPFSAIKLKGIESFWQAISAPDFWF